MALFRWIFYVIASLGLVGPYDAEGACPDWVVRGRDKLPACPKQGMTILDDTYPASAVFLSGLSPSLQYDPSLTADVILRIWDAAPNKPPGIFLSMHEEQFKKVQALILDKAKSQREKDQVAALLTRTPPVITPWTQDLFQTFKSEDGKQALRASPRGKGAPDLSPNLRSLSEDLAACGVRWGEPLPRHSPVRADAMSGGNLEALPGGACLVGVSRQDERWVQQSKVCSRILPISVRWLSTGHVDEVVRIVETPEARPCNFRILLPSPKLAMTVLADSANQGAPFFEGGIPSSPGYSRPRANALLNQICLGAKAHKERMKPEPDSSSEGVLEGVGSKPTLHLRFSTAQAKSVSRDTVLSCEGISNGDIVRYLRSQNSLRTQIEIIESDLLQAENSIRQQLRKDLPNCQPKFVRVPVLFGEVERSGPRGGRLGLADRAFGAILPNPVNGISIGGRYLTSDPMNGALRNHMVEELRREGIESTMVNTYHFNNLHSGGNLHCITNVLRTCRD